MAFASVHFLGSIVAAFAPFSVVFTDGLSRMAGLGSGSPPAALLRAFGWRTAMLLLGVFLGCMTIPLHALVLRRRPADLGLHADGRLPAADLPITAVTGVSFRAALSGQAFWLLTLAFGLIALSAAAIRVHFIPFLIETQMESSTAAFAIGVIGIMQVIGRLIFAPLDHRFSTQMIAVGVFALHGLALGALIIFVVIFGAAQGVVTLARPSMLAERYGVSHYGRISSIMALFLTLTSTAVAAPLIASG